MGIFLLCALTSVVVGWLGRNKKFGFWGCFFCSLALTPIIGLIIVLASDDRKTQDDRAAPAPEASRPSA